MKKFFVTIIAVIIATSFGATQQVMANNSQASEPTNTESSEVLLGSHYTGVIGNNLYITAYIQVHSNGSYTGWYYYNKNGANNKLELSGYKDDRGVVVLREYNNYGDQTGYFEGTFNRNGEFIGIMHVIYNGKRYACRLTPRR